MYVILSLTHILVCSFFAFRVAKQLESLYLKPSYFPGTEVNHVTNLFVILMNDAFLDTKFYLEN